MKTQKITLVALSCLAFAIMLGASLSACTAKDATVDATTDASTNPTPSPSPVAATCNIADWGGGFDPTATGLYISDATTSTLNDVTVYFAPSGSGSVGTKSIAATAYSCGFGGSTIATNTQSVNLALSDNYYSVTFHFGGASIPLCSGSKTIAIKFVNGSGGTIYYGAKHFADSSCTMGVSDDISSNPVTADAGGLWAVIGTYN